MKQMGKQMELFQEGGLKDEGGTKDPVSGNDVPPGATQEEVRDDIPAQLSEGEFVFPADVVRYIGLEKLMRMRQEAKMGLKMMEDMGQMGNADEATIPDDIPFSVIDIQIAEGDDDDDEVEKRAEGGVIEAANGFAGTTTATNPLQTRQSSMTASPTGLKTAYTAPVIPTATVAPTGGFKYKSPIEAKQRATFKGLFGGEELTQGPDEYRTYVNDSGAEIQIPFKNGKILTGFSIPEGFKPKTEKVDTAKIQSARSKTARVEQESGGDPDPRDTQTVVSLGGRIGSDGRVKDAKSFAFSVNPPKDMGMNIITMGKMVAGGITGNYPAGTTFNFQPLDENGNPKGSVVKNVPAEVYQNAKTVTDRKGVKRTSITNSKAQDLATVLGAMENFDVKEGLTYSELTKLGTTPEQIAQNIKDSQFTKEQERKAERITSQEIGDETPTLQGDDETFTKGDKGTQVFGGIVYDDPVGIGYDNNSSDDAGGFEGTGMGGGGSDFDSGEEDAIAKGSLITKRKASGKLKKKYMKRGGLASK